MLTEVAASPLPERPFIPAAPLPSPARALRLHRLLQQTAEQAARWHSERRRASRRRPAPGSDADGPREPSLGSMSSAPDEEAAAAAEPAASPGATRPVVGSAAPAARSAGAHRRLQTPAGGAPGAMTRLHAPPPAYSPFGRASSARPRPPAFSPTRPATSPARGRAGAPGARCTVAADRHDAHAPSRGEGVAGSTARGVDRDSDAEDGSRAGSPSCSDSTDSVDDRPWWQTARLNAVPPAATPRIGDDRTGVAAGPTTSAAADPVAVLTRLATPPRGGPQPDDAASPAARSSDALRYRASGDLRRDSAAAAAAAGPAGFEAVPQLRLGQLALTARPPDPALTRLEYRISNALQGAAAYRAPPSARHLRTFRESPRLQSARAAARPAAAATAKPTMQGCAVRRRDLEPAARREDAEDGDEGDEERWLLHPPRPPSSAERQAEAAEAAADVRWFERQLRRWQQPAQLPAPAGEPAEWSAPAHASAGQSQGSAAEVGARRRPPPRSGSYWELRGSGAFDYSKLDKRTREALVSWNGGRALQLGDFESKALEQELLQLVASAALEEDAREQAREVAARQRVLTARPRSQRRRRASLRPHA